MRLVIGEPPRLAHPRFIRSGGRDRGSWAVQRIAGILRMSASSRSLSRHSEFVPGFVSSTETHVHRNAGPVSPVNEPAGSAVQRRAESSTEELKPPEVLRLLHAPDKSS